MRRGTDFLIVVVAAGALIFGGYWLGHAVWQTGAENRSRVIGETQLPASDTQVSPASATQLPASGDRSARTQVSDATSRTEFRLALLAAAAFLVVATATKSMRRTKRHHHGERWQA